jgi:hypothetical protein
VTDDDENPIEGRRGLFKSDLVLRDTACSSQNFNTTILERLGFLCSCCVGAHVGHFLANESAMLVKSAIKIPSAMATKIPEIIQNRIITVVSGHPSNSK